MQAFCGTNYSQQDNVKCLPRISLDAHVTLSSSSARTRLKQTFSKPLVDLLDLCYEFPLYDGISIVDFRLHIGTRILHSRVTPKEHATTAFNDATSNDKKASLLEHSTRASDIFTIHFGRICAGEEVTVEITFVEELKQDAQADAIRYTLPSIIAPRYSSTLHYVPCPQQSLSDGVTITVDVTMDETSPIREIQSPTHAIKPILGRTSSLPESTPYTPSQASASLRLIKAEALLATDFILLVRADGISQPRALLESHPRITNQRALMTTLIPKFTLPAFKPEVIFLVDCSGSMHDKMPTVRTALKVFLKSLPMGTYFNIWYFGNTAHPAWPTSQVYNPKAMEYAIEFVEALKACMGGTEMQRAVEAVVRGRREDRELQVLVLTDGLVWDENGLFGCVRGACTDESARFFALGIGRGVSWSLVEGIARAGNGFAQMVVQYEEVNRKVVRMLKGALTPRVWDYRLEVEYEDYREEYDIVSEVGSSDSCTEVASTESLEERDGIPLYDSDFQEPGLGHFEPMEEQAAVPFIVLPKTIQAPHKIPMLYPFMRSTVYVLLDRHSDRVPRSVSFHGMSKEGPLELHIPIHDIGTGETIHQLACRKATTEIEEKGGWLADAKDKQGKPITRDLARRHELMARECHRLGTRFQVTGKYCSFVAVEEQTKTPEENTATVTEEAEVGSKSWPDSGMRQNMTSNYTAPGSQPSTSQVSTSLFAAKNHYGPLWGRKSTSSVTAETPTRQSDRFRQPYDPPSTSTIPSQKASQRPRSRNVGITQAFCSFSALNNALPSPPPTQPQNPTPDSKIHYLKTQ